MDSGAIPEHSGAIPEDSCGFLRIPAGMGGALYSTAEFGRISAKLEYISKFPCLTRVLGPHNCDKFHATSIC